MRGRAQRASSLYPKMMRRSVQAALSSSYSGSTTTSGIPFLIHSTPLVVPLFHSQPPNHSTTKSLEHPLNLFHEMLRSCPPPPVTTSNTRLFKLKHYSAVISLNRKMLLFGIVPDEYTLNILISDLSSKGVQPDVFTYSIMIHGLGHHGLIIEAEKLLREMGGKGCPPDGWTYNNIIKGLLRYYQTLLAVGLIQEMVQCGFSADASTMALIVSLLCKDVVDPALLPLLKEA